MKQTFAALLTSTALLASPLAAFDIENMSAAEQDAFGAAVRSYLLENPTVLMEVVEALESSQAQAQAANDADLLTQNAAALYEDPNSWIGGNPDGDVTIVEFIDYRCGYCRRAFPEVADLINTDGNIKLIVKEYPILGEESTLASQFAVATKLVAGEAAYKSVHDDLMEFRGNITKDSLAALAIDNDLPADRIVAMMDSDQVADILRANRELGQRMAINGTPSFIFGDQVIRGYVPLEGMMQIVAEERG